MFGHWYTPGMKPRCSSESRRKTNEKALSAPRRLGKGGVRCVLVRNEEDVPSIGYGGKSNKMTTRRQREHPGARARLQSFEMRPPNTPVRAGGGGRPYVRRHVGNAAPCWFASRTNAQRRAHSLFSSGRWRATRSGFPAPLTNRARNQGPDSRSLARSCGGCQDSPARYLGPRPSPSHWPRDFVLRPFCSIAWRPCPDPC